ncbi:MAG: branched-chain amino acid ABC transporter permease [Chloroflexi bacterium]|nr:branched-chain amino acid ABC transporter permease [Chloroflexota bacterium]
MSSDQLVQYLFTGLTQGSLYALIALGFAITFTVTGIINFAQGEFVMLGGMISYLILDNTNIPIGAAFLISIIAVSLTGVLLERLAIRPARNAPVVTLIIITIGASIFIRGMVGEFIGKDPVPIPPFTGNGAFTVLGATVTYQSLWVIGIAMVSVIGFYLLLSRTMIGKALRACSINKRAASLMGINASNMSTLSFLISAALGSIGGILIAPLAFAQVTIGVSLGLKGFVAAAIGGFTNIPLIVAGALGLGVVEQLGGATISAYKDAIALGVLLLVLIIRARWLQTAAGSE